jgi:hypothetical protein
VAGDPVRIGKVAAGHRAELTMAAEAARVRGDLAAALVERPARQHDGIGLRRPSGESENPEHQ